MRFADYDKSFFTESELQKYKLHFEQYISQKQKELGEFIERGSERLKIIDKWDKEKNYTIHGGLRKYGKEKMILLIIRYPDGTQRDERYIFSKIADAREKLKELRKIHLDVDWSAFKEEI